MLQSLYIENIVLIDRLTLEFEEGLTALTGETGAGKSILLDSIALLTGKKADRSLIRKGEESALVVAVFSVSAANGDLHTYLKESGITLPEGEDLLIRRQLFADGRSRAYVNEQPVSVSFLRALGDALVEIHGQHDNKGLLDPASHITFLDRFSDVPDLIEDLWSDWRKAEESLAVKRDKIAAAARQEDYLRSMMEDLEELDPRPGEEEELSSARSRLRHAEQIAGALGEALSLSSEADSAISRAWRVLQKQVDKAPELIEPLIEALDRAGAEIQESVQHIQLGQADMEEGGTTLENVESRLFALRACARRHHCLVDELARRREEIVRELQEIEAGSADLEGLEKDAAEKKSVYWQEAQRLDSRRRERACELEKKVMKEFTPLKLKNAVFKVSIQTMPQDKGGPRGCNRVLFEIATNPGDVPGPLHKIASGGELARIMLAIKAVLGAEIDKTMIFDEVDTGIGGSTAAAVGERLASLGAGRQVLVVTHSPQVAACARHHMIVSKSQSGAVVSTGQKEKATLTHVEKLSNNNQRREEIARMLAGAEISDEARAAASRLLSSG